MTTEPWSIILVVIAVAFGSFGPLFLKMGSGKLTRNVKKLMKNWYIPLGLFFYGSSSLVFIYALRGGELSVLYPFVATGYIWTSLLSVKFLKERMNFEKWTGILFIIIGVTLIGFGSTL